MSLLLRLLRPRLGSCVPRLLANRLGSLSTFPVRSPSGDSQPEELRKPIGRYPIPYKKELPFDIVELMEEVEKKVTINWKKAELSPRELAMLEFALAVSRADDITEEHFKKLELHGFDREDAWDIASISAFFCMSNRIAHFIDLIPNKEFYSLGRTNDQGL
uniref:Carboxymuconolactone decarboxylase-like domain-containing protein n=1 Tax=Monodelphis domestica TaxID=13616 RepID=F7FSD8_MONDO